MDMKNYQYRSDFARQYVAQGREEGRIEGQAEGRGEMLIEFLELKFGALPPTVLDRLKMLDGPQQRALMQRALRTDSLDELLTDEG